ncbi:9673_t:CDS:2, partial [Ambispora gerdemannii]
RIVIIFLDGLHHLQKFVDHNHSPQASSASIVKTTAHIKKQAQETNNQPAQIIQNNIVNVPEEIHPYISSHNALHIKIKHARRTEMSPQPKTLDEINISDSLHSTLDGDLFLVRDSIIDQGRILLFTTRANIQHLNQILFWIMDGTFKTVPTLFRQLYTIHAPVGSENNSRILPLVYILMTSKSEELYIKLFQDLINFAEENDIQLKSSRILTDFEQAAINASNIEFSGVTNKECFFYLGQSGWRKIQNCGLATQYGENEHFSFMLRHLFALAFLSQHEISAAFDILKLEMSPEAKEVVQWFEDNYVHGRMRTQLRNGIPRTQNNVEAWYCRWETLIGQAHVGVYTIIKEFQKEQQKVEFQIENILRGEQRPKPRKKILDREKRIMTVVENRANCTVMEFLHEIAHNLSL